MLNGRISRLIEHQQAGSISADDGDEYTFTDANLRGVTFKGLSLGMAVSFSPRISNNVRRAEFLSPAPKPSKA